MNAKEIQTIGLILILIGFVPIASNMRELGLAPVIICAVGGLLFLIGLYLNGWKLYEASQEV